MRAPDHQRLSQEAMADFVRVLAKTGRYDLASKAIGASCDTTIRWRNRSKQDPKDERYLMTDPLGETEPRPFHEACKEAMDVFIESRAEAVLIEQATGYLDPVLYQGRLCFEPDTEAEERYDPISGAVYYPPKIDPVTGQPVPLAIRKVNTNSLHFFLKAKSPDYREKSEVDVTSGGRPIFFPAKSASTEDFLKEVGSSRVKVAKPDAT